MGPLLSVGCAPFSRDGQAGRIERCLFTAGHAGYQENILPLLFNCATTPYFLGFAEHIIWLDHLARVQEEFGWDQAGELVFNLGAKLVRVAVAVSLNASAETPLPSWTTWNQS